MRKLLVDKETKNVIGWSESQTLENWNGGSAELVDCDNIETIIDNLAGHYLADDGTIQFDESRILKPEDFMPPPTANEALETV